MSKIRQMLATSPRVRGLVALLVIIGAFISPNPLLLAAGLMSGILPVVAATGLFTRFIKFVLVVILPIALGLFFVWGWLVAAPPGNPTAARLLQAAFTLLMSFYDWHWFLALCLLAS